ncbi:MAG: DUF2007 domain-containing protein [Bacteroidota bacterium]|nr:DUF2007 domain-containing protein [Bacteroidota bacterium]
MENDWVLIYSASKAYEAEILKEVLDDNNIVCVIINKQDSSYQFGEVEVYVQKQNEVKAIEISKNFKA